MKKFFFFILLSVNAFAFDPMGKVTEESYLSVIDLAQKTFGPYLALSGNILNINKSWSSVETSSFADFRNPPVYNITLNGGAFRTKAMTNDGLLYTVCHEVNHIIGGDPKYSPGYWPSIEGQADYMATNTCLRLLLKDEDNRAIISRMTIPKEVESACSGVYPDSGESALCQRSAMAGFVFAENYRAFKAKPGEFQRIYPMISFSKKDPSRVTETNRSYTSPQCRFDTALAGALCVKGKNYSLKKWNDPNQYVCGLKDAVNSQRPRCWLKY